MTHHSVLCNFVTTFLLKTIYPIRNIHVKSLLHTKENSHQGSKRLYL